MPQLCGKQGGYDTSHTLGVSYIFWFVCYPAVRKANNQFIDWLLIAFAGALVAKEKG
jgi:hypothetical protein